MNLGLEGKTAVVGASSEGLGFETARALADEGVRVLLTGRDADKLEAARARIGEAALARTADLGTRAGARAQPRRGVRSAVSRLAFAKTSARDPKKDRASSAQGRRPPGDANRENVALPDRTGSQG